MATALDHVNWAYAQADRLAAGKYPYTFGGGHPTPYLPWVKIDPKTGAVVPAKGPDCSGWVCNILWHAGLLEDREALDTQWLESWGVTGKGQHLTVWVLDEPQIGGIHHTFLEINAPGKPHRWSAASHAGTIAGWHDEWDTWITNGYRPRHSKIAGV